MSKTLEKTLDPYLPRELRNVVNEYLIFTFVRKFTQSFFESLPEELHLFLDFDKLAEAAFPEFEKVILRAREWYRGRDRGYIQNEIELLTQAFHERNGWSFINFVSERDSIFNNQSILFLYPLSRCINSSCVSIHSDYIHKAKFLFYLLTGNFQQDLVQT